LKIIKDVLVGIQFEVFATNPNQSCLLHIYDRLAALGRAMKRSSIKSTNSQSRHLIMVTKTHAEKTTRQGKSKQVTKRRK
jgi:hypothetical protein